MNVAQLATWIRERRKEHFPLLVALDGRSGVGKTTLADQLARRLEAVVVPEDDFFAAGVSAAQWDLMTPALRANNCIDWHRLRDEALLPLLARRTARWHAFDWEAGPRDDGTFGMREAWTERLPADFIILDGAYSSSSELGDIVNIKVLVHTPETIRRARLAAREDAATLAAWFTRWGAAEDHFFAHVQAPGVFDLVVAGE